MQHILEFEKFVLNEETSKIYPSQAPSGLTPEQEDFLNSYTEGTWSVNQTTGRVDIRGNFNFGGQIKGSFLRVFLGNVTGYCNCSVNKLQYLEGAPQEVGGDFNCSHNDLLSLKGGPKIVDGNFECIYNELQSLEGAPQEVDGDFWCYGNKLRSLAGAPKKINGEFRSDGFQFNPGKWDMNSWAEILKSGSQWAKKLILTLPYLQPDWWKLELKRDPGKTVHLLAPWWKDMPEDMKSQIKIPSGYENEFDLFSGFDELGLF